LAATDFLRLTYDGAAATLPHLTFATVSGQPGVEQLSGLSSLTAQGSYTLTFDATKLSDYYGPGVGQTSVNWIIDKTAPTSHVNSLPASETSTSFVVSASGTDPTPAPGVMVSGVASYDLYVSTNGGPFAYWTTVPAANPSATFAGQGGQSYGFQSFATDAAGNRESKPAAIEAGTYVPDLTPPVSQVTYVGSSNQNFVVAFAGSAAAGNVLDHIDVFVEVDDGPAMPITKSAASSGTVNYEAIADGTSHTYTFYSIGVDRAGNVQPTPVGPEAGVSVTATFAAPASNLPIALTVNHGAAGRSFVEYADLYFDNGSGLASLISGNHIHLVQHSLSDTGSTTISPSAYTLSVVDNAIELNFGASGLGGNPTSTAGDGYYEIDVDGIAEAFHFGRILGDVNGDGTVDSTDVNLVTEYLGSSVPGQVINVDGSGTVSAADRIITQRAKGHALAAGLHLDA
jgi:hypothetical protein